VSLSTSYTLIERKRSQFSWRPINSSIGGAIRPPRNAPTTHSSSPNSATSWKSRAPTSGQPLSAASQTVHDHGLVSVLRELHDDLDRAVAEAYGWSPALSTEDILFRLVELNAARAAEERSGLVRWLRPEFQSTTATQAGLGVEMEEEEQQPARAGRLPWPLALPERVRAVRDYLMQTPAPVAPEIVARNFTRARLPDVKAILETLTALGHAKQDAAGYHA
jgi:hypothetical protein